MVTFQVNARTGSRGLAERTAEALARGETAVWRSSWRGYGPARRAAERLEAAGHRPQRGHVPEGQETLWAWRPADAGLEAVGFYCG